MHGKLGVSTDLGLLLQGAQEGQRSRLPAHDYEVVEQAVQLHNQLLDGHVVPQLLLDLHRSVSLSRVVQHGLEVAPLFDVRLHETDVVQVVSVGDCYAAGQTDEVLVVGRAAQNSIKDPFDNLDLGPARKQEHADVKYKRQSFKVRLTSIEKQATNTLLCQEHVRSLTCAAQMIKNL